MTKAERPRKTVKSEAESPRDIEQVEGFGAAMRKIMGVSKEEIARRERAAKAKR